jgi:hypothetical protein
VEAISVGDGDFRPFWLDGVVFGEDFDFIARQNANDFDGIADHVGGALLALGTRRETGSRHADFGGQRRHRPAPRRLAMDRRDRRPHMLKDQWTIIELPAIALDNDQLRRPKGEALWPAQFPLEALARRRDNTLARYWSALHAKSGARGGRAILSGQD